MTPFDDPAVVADGFIAVATLASAAWVAGKAYRAWRRPPTSGGRDSHALSPLGAALDPFRGDDDPAYAILRPEQVAAIQRQAGFNLAINVANAIILEAVVVGTANRIVLLAWLCVVVWVVWRGIRQWRRNRRRPVPPTVSKRTLRRMTYHAAVLGLLWGGGFAIFYGDANAVGRVVLVALGMGMAAGGTVAMAASPGAAATFMACVLGPGIVRLLTTGVPGDPTLATLCMLYACSMTATLTEVYDSFARNVLARAAQREQAETIALLLNTYEEHASGWLWKADRAGFLLEAPPRLERLLGVAAGSLFGRPLWAIEDDKQASRAGWNDLIRDLREGRAFRDRVVAARRDGDGGTVWLSLSGRQLPDGNWRGAGTDVTAREVAVRALTAAMEAASAGVDAKSRFLATVSHELRTPLNAIIGFAEAMQAGVTGTLNEKQAEYLDDIHRSGQFLLRLVNDILDLSKADADRLEIVEDTVDVPAVIAEAVRTVAKQATAAGIAVDVAVDPALPAVRADGRRLRQALINLLSNAVKFTPAGGHIKIAASVKADGAVTLIVADDGIGMTPEDIPKALERFGQIDSRLERRYEGTGLGLPLAHRLVELHGGRLEIDSAEGTGTRVTITLPPSRTVAGAGAASAEPVAGQPSAGRSG